MDPELCPRSGSGTLKMSELYQDFIELTYRIFKEYLFEQQEVEEPIVHFLV